MDKKLIAFSSVLFLTLSLPLIPANAAAKAGAKCTKAGSTEVVKDKSYTCIKLGKKLVWDKGVIFKTPTQTFTPTPTPSIDPIKVELQKIVDSIDYEAVSSDVKVTYVIESGRNGIYQTAIVNGIADSIRALKFIAGYSPYSEIIVSIGRSQEWLKDQRSIYCNKEITDDIVAADSIAPCQVNNKSGLIEINLTGVVTNEYLRADPKKDLTNYTVDKYTMQKVRNLAPHEYFHFWQYSIGQWQVPSWFKEGTAQVFSIFVRAKQDGGKESYARTFSDWWNEGDIAWSKNKCQTGISKLTYSMETQCQYLQGIFPVEVLLAKYGLKTFVRLTELTGKMNFPEAFFQATGTDLEEFYQIVDNYTYSLGWRSGR